MISIHKPNRTTRISQTILNTGTRPDVFQRIPLNSREGAAHTAHPDVTVVSSDQCLQSEFRRQQDRNQGTPAEAVKTGRCTHPNVAFSIFQNACCIITGQTILGREALDGAAKLANLPAIQPVRRRNAPHSVPEAGDPEATIVIEENPCRSDS